MDYKEALFVIARTLGIAGLFYVLTFLYHEAVHLFVLNMTGGEGHMIFGQGFGFVVIDKLPTVQYGDIIVAFSGGIAMGFILLILALILLDDAEEKAALIPLAIMQLTYGIFEGCFIRSMSLNVYLELAQLVSYLALAFGTLPSMYILYNKLTK